MSTSRFVQLRLSNGLAVVIEVMPHVPSVACGFLARTGARDEHSALAGVSHFLEHMCFKGTARRDWQRINIEFDEMGSQYNAYTSKDRTFYYGWVRAEELERQLDLLADMMRSTLPAGEFDVEKQVVLEEIAMSGDDLSSNAYDLLYESLCPDSPLAWPVLGYERTIRELSVEQMRAYHASRYAPENLTLVVAGRVDPENVVAMAERLCGDWPAVEAGPRGPAPVLRSGVARRSLELFHQQAVVLAFPAAPGTHELNETAESIAAILGGSNSRFYWNIMQKGLSTQAAVFREEYGDFGLMVLYALCEPAHCERVLEAMRHEAQTLVEQGPEPKEVQRVKNLRRTSLAVEAEAPFYRLGQIVDDMEYHGQPRSAEERLAAVERVSDESIRDYLQQFPITGEGLLVSVGPRAWPES